MAMTLEEVRDRLREENRILGQMDQRHAMVNRSYLEAWADAIDAHITQPAQAVDVGAIHRVIRSMCNSEYVEGRHVLADILHKALAGEQAGWRDIASVPKGKRILCCWLGSPGCHEVDVAVYATEGVDRPRWVAPDDSFCEYGKPDLWQPMPEPPDNGSGIDDPDGPWADGWHERSGLALPASPRRTRRLSDE